VAPLPKANKRPPDAPETVFAVAWPLTLADSGSNIAKVPAAKTLTAT
jgi:hypothetical protein